VHLRRALLLFAIVLGLAALAASVSRPHDSDSPATTATERQGRTTEPSELEGEAAPGSADVTFVVDHARAHRIEAGQAATVVVEVPEAGQVSIDSLGMTSTAEPTTPARFDVLTSAAGRYPITFNPAGSSESLSAGTLVVE
jgi:Tfp pilus assembly protein PilV